MANEPITALYERLSRDDRTAGESNSIINQKRLLEQYAVSHGFTNFRHFADDGVTGTTWQRDGWQAVLDGIENGEITVLITKDTSRLGRDYLQVGWLMEQYFPSKGVRYIAVSDNVDTQNGLDDFSPFRNILNEMHAKDTSRKVRAVLRSKAQSGVRVNGSCPLGYYYKQDDKRKLQIDTKHSAEVKDVFALFVGGKNYTQIAEIMTGRTNRPWNVNSVKRILHTPEYAGDTACLKTRRISFKNKKVVRVPRNDWVVTKATHEPIIDCRTYNTAQRILARVGKRRTDKNGEAYPLGGLLFCGDCNAKMYLNRNFYECGAFKNKKKCFAHRAKRDVLEKFVFDEVSALIAFVVANEAQFAQLLAKQSGESTALSNVGAELDEVIKREEEVDDIMKKIYEDNALGRLSDERFNRMNTAFEREHKELAERRAFLQAQIKQTAENAQNAGRFTEIVKRCKDTQTPDIKLVSDLIDRVFVYKKHGTTSIKIIYNAIGAFEKPIDKERTE